MRDTFLPFLADSNAMPIEKKLGILILFGAIAVFATLGLFASASRLEQMAGFIGTKKPLVARVVCAITALVGFGAVALVVSTFMTGWDR